MLLLFAAAIFKRGTQKKKTLSAVCAAAYKNKIEEKRTDGRDGRTDGGKVRSLLRFVAAAFQLPRFINEKSTPGI